MLYPRALPVLLVLVAFLPACARKTPPVATPPSSIFVRLAAGPTLGAELEQLFAAPALARAQWAVLIQSLDTAETLYRLNPAKLMMPASNMKLLTLAAAADRLGWDYRFQTKLLAHGELSDGSLRGDLIVFGSGDPSINGRGGDATRFFQAWAKELWDGGLRRVEGRIIGDDNLFDDESLGAGWAWDYLAYGYAAPVTALEFNEDAVELVFRAASSPGEPVAIEMRPENSGLTLLNRVSTSAEGASVSLDLRRLPGTARLDVTGTVPAGTPEFTRTASVDNPTEFFARALRASLISAGILVDGEAVDVDSLPAPPDHSNDRVLLVHQSAPLAEIATVLMKSSQNLYADTLLKTLGVHTSGAGTAEAGRKVVRQVLEGWGIPPDSFVMYDGSGLSRYNYVTAETLIAILQQMHSDPKHAAAFVATLPVAGQDGTLAGRMRGTRAEGNVRAKTGSISNVRSLSGYVRTLDGELLAFAILANNFTVPQESVDALTDRAVERLANFTRR